MRLCSIETLGTALGGLPGPPVSSTLLDLFSSTPGPRHEKDDTDPKFPRVGTSGAAARHVACARRCYGFPPSFMETRSRLRPALIATGAEKGVSRMLGDGSIAGPRQPLDSPVSTYTGCA